MCHLFKVLLLLCLATVVPSALADRPYTPPTYAVSDNLAVRINRHIFDNAPKPPSSTPMSRCNSISFVAMNDAINSIHAVNENALVAVPVRGRDKTASVRAAMLGAFQRSRAECMKRLPNNYKANVLLFTDADLEPYQTALNSFVQTELSALRAVESDRDVDAGLAIGQRVADLVLAARENDGYKVPAPVQDHVCGVEGQWCSWTETNKPADARGAGYPNWGGVKPFSFAHPSEFTVPAPPKVGDMLFDYSRNQTRAFGAINSQMVSQQMRDETHAWSLGAGGELGARIVDSLFVAADLRMSDFEAVAVLGRLYIGNCDALIANLYNKYKYNAWRPYQVIRQTTDDTNWLPYLTTPVNQEYPCGHCMGTAGALTPVMESLGFDIFPTTGVVSLVSPGQRASPSFKSFTEVFHHVNTARVLGGMHFYYSTEKGSEYGTAIGKHVAATMFRSL